MTIENLNEYFLEYQNYKEGNYKFGNYRTREHIFDDFYNGKIFVIKGGLRNYDLLLLLVLPMTNLLFSLSFFLAGFIVNDVLFWGSLIFFLLGVLMFIFNSILFLKYRRFLVIGPKGVYYRKTKETGFFSWDDVLKIEESIRTHRKYPIMFPLTTAKVEIYLKTQRKKIFSSHLYVYKEFSQKFHQELFISLFQIYCKLGQNRRTEINSIACKICGIKLTKNDKFCSECSLKMKLF